MDFFERQEHARQRTTLLICYFVLAVVGIIAVLQVVFALLLGLKLTDGELFLWVAGCTLVVVAGGSLSRMAELSRGGRVVAAMLGGEPLLPTTTDLGERRLLNVVEEMAIASGVPVPEIFILPDPAINAFAAGHGPGDTAIGVTRGAIERLTRDELQGVIGHEFSHILHGDMRLNLRLMGVLHGILCIALLGGILLRITFYLPSDGDRDSRKGGGLVIALLGAGLALYLIGWIGVFFGNLIKAAVSRQREFLADASAVQYTRNPPGLAGALWKIGRLTGRLANPRASEASHMYFGNGVAEPLLPMFATHPPLQQRIEAIAPGFTPSEAPSPVVAPAASPPPVRPAAMFGAGAKGGAALATPLLATLPEGTLDASREVASAAVLVYAQLLDDDASRREAQLTGWQVTDAVRAETLREFARRGGLVGAARLAVVDLAIPALRTMSHEQYEEFRASVKHLAESDQQIDLFEFVLHKVLLRHLDLYFTKSTGSRIRYRSIIPLLADVATLLSGVALAGHADPEARRQAFANGVRELLVKPSSYLMAPAETCDLVAIGNALDRIAEASPGVKRTVLAATAHCAAHDDLILPQEYELVRAIAESLDCPMPPVMKTDDATPAAA